MARRSSKQDQKPDAETEGQPAKPEDEAVAETAKAAKAPEPGKALVAKRECALGNGRLQQGQKIGRIVLSDGVTMEQARVKILAGAKAECDDRTVNVTHDGRLIATVTLEKGRDFCEVRNALNNPDMVQF